MSDEKHAFDGVTPSPYYMWLVGYDPRIHRTPEARDASIRACNAKSMLSATPPSAPPPPSRRHCMP
jgi:hypothetical protein